MNNYQGYITPQASAAGVIKYSILLEKDGPTAKFIDQDGEIMAW